MDWAERVAMRLVLLCRSDGGRLRRTGYIEAALRAALLVDVVLERGIDCGVDQFWIDCRDTGFAPADLLLASIEGRPDRSLGWWIGRGPAVQAALAREWVKLGRWRVERQSRLHVGDHYVDSGEAGAAAVLGAHERIDAARAGERVAAGDAALAVLARSAELTGEYRPPVPALLHACGPSALAGHLGRCVHRQFPGEDP